MKKITWRQGLIVAAAVLLIAAAALILPRLLGGSDEEEIAGLQNGDFSLLDDDGNPLYWEKDGYGALSDVTFRVEKQEDGANIAHITSRTLHDARFAQQVKVEPDTLYHLHGWIKANAVEGLGANLSVAGVYAFSDSVYDSEGEWQEVSLYGRTQQEQTTLTVFVRLGGYSGESSGDAWFKEISLKPVDSVPDGYAVLSWGVATAKTDSGTNSAPSTGKGYLILFTVAYAVIFLGLINLFRQRENRDAHSLEDSDPLYTYIVIAMMALGFAARMAICFLVPGYDVDIGCFSSWALRMASVGPAEFYQNTFCDYPPGYLVVLQPLGWICNLIYPQPDIAVVGMEGWQDYAANTEALMGWLVKIPPILADMALCLILYRMAKKRMSHPAAIALTGLYLFNPLILTTGAAWGQADAVMVLLLILVVIFALRERWIVALPCYMAAVLVKPQALMFGPLGVAALVLYILMKVKRGEQKKKLLDVGLGLAITLALAAAVIIPFSIHQSWDWLIRLYGTTMTSYDRATINGANLYFLLGHNWNYVTANISGQPLIPLLSFALIALPVAGVWCKRAFADRRYIRPLDDQKNTRTPWGTLRFTVLGGILLGHALYLLLKAVGGYLTFKSLGACMVSLCVTLTLAQFILSRELRNLPIYGAICLLALFNTGAMMHERYLVPAVALLLLGYILQEKKDNRLLWLAAGVTLAGFLNVGCVLNRNIRIGGAAGHLDAPLMGIRSDLSGLEYLASALNPLLCACAVAYGAALCHDPAAESERAVSVRVRRGIGAAVITAVYAVLAFTNLGSMKAPQTAWVAAEPDDQVVLDLGVSRSFHLAYFGGIHEYDSDFTVEISNDGQHWTDSYKAGLKIGDCFKWKYLSDYVDGILPVELYGQYIRITADHYDLTLFEVLALDPYTHASLPLSAVSDPNDTAAALFDEPGEEEPESPWVAQKPGDWVLLDLGEARSFHLAYYGGDPTYDSDFIIEASNDLLTWQSYDAHMGYDQPFQWQYLTHLDGEDEIQKTVVRGRYIRIRATQESLTLYELRATDVNSGELLPLSTVENHLIDEPDMEGEPGWYNSSYFDEIYHARTGYELLHRLQPYEWTHPPLGKVFMSWCISLFGMTPFGWRFAGALAGVLMLPGMYLIGSMLTKRKWGGFAAMLLMAFDLMHYTQTRIATIDSFVVLFIIWMVYFMLRWFYLDFFGMKFWKTLVPLFLSGLMLGFAIASKWTGVYAAVGIAIIFFWGLIRRSVQIFQARRIPPDKRNLRARNAANGIPLLLITVGCCFIFFIFIPLLIYYLSYVPFFGYDPGGISVVKVIQQAVGTYFEEGRVGGMLGYHSQQGLGMDHFFYSPWYQWPLIAKPMWYASNSFEPEGYQSSIMALGNPAVWWTGLIALFAVLCLWARRHINDDYTLSLQPRPRDSRYGLLLICFFSQYLPWMLVPRGTYIYHYFPLVPFIILCTVFCFDLLSLRRPKMARISMWALVGLAAALMVAFFPYASGLQAPEGWMDKVKWFDRWLWY